MGAREPRPADHLRAAVEFCLWHWWLVLIVALLAWGAATGDHHKASDGGRRVQCWEVDLAACPGYKD